jgi:hypothetical protein
MDRPPEELEEAKRERQRTSDELVSSTGRIRLVVAGPGTGKTHNFRRVLEGAGGGLALIFIRALMRELQRDLGDLAQVNTFHGYCKSLAHKVGGTDGLTSHFHYFRFLPRLVVEDPRVLGHGGLKEADIDHLFHVMDDKSEVLKASLQIGSYYDAVGHTDVVYRVQRHLEANPESVPEHEVIVVDEYQDFNLLDTSLIDTLAGKSPVVLAGDDDQALYHFRDATPDFIRELALGYWPSRRRAPHSARGDPAAEGPRSDPGVLRGHRPRGAVEQVVFDLISQPLAEYRCSHRAHCPPCPPFSLRFFSWRGGRCPGDTRPGGPYPRWADSALAPPLVIRSALASAVCSSLGREMNDLEDFETYQEDRRRAKAGEHVAARFQAEFFNCVWCGVLTSQQWQRVYVGGSAEPMWRCKCDNCARASYWFGDDQGSVMILPAGRQGPMPHPDMPEDVKADYNEARDIVGKSPRGAGGLARLAVQKLVNELEPDQAGKANDLNAKIGRLVENGLSETVQQSLDALRVIGNNAVHPLELDLRDDVETVVAVFECMNLIVEERVSRPGRVRKLYDRLPEGARAAIQRHDRVDEESRKSPPDG